MSLRVNIGVRVYAAGLFTAMAMCSLPGAASAQTTVTISAPEHVADAKIQGGTYANTVFDNQPLATKVHPTTVTYTRRSVLKFDTHNTVPLGAPIQSAKLTLTLKVSDSATRTLAIYRLSQTFDELYTSWNTRKSGTRWTSVGGDLAEKFAQTSVGFTVGAKVSFDVTTLVQGVVSGKYGSSRYTRVALVDVGSGSNTSYKEFYSEESTNAAVRPVLTVVYGGSTTSSAPAPAPTPSTTSAVRLKFLDWNVHYSGMGTDGQFNPGRVIDHIVRFNPDIISLNEVTRYAWYNSSVDYSAYYTQQLKARTGKTWYSYYRTDNGASKGVGNMVLSRFPIASTSYCQLSSRRVAVNAAVYVNGKLINVWSTHLDSSDTGTYRIAEVKALQSCLSSFAQQRIVAGDFNARDYTTEINSMESAYYDGWAEAAADRTAIDYPGNTAFGATRNRRIDYVWASKGASALTIKSAQVYDTRDSRGYMPSDHKPLMVIFEVR
jgi:endonuclease/exonuclease/phosphatase family metal-dependent hydrolase